MFYKLRTEAVSHKRTEKNKEEKKIQWQSLTSNVARKISCFHELSGYFRSCLKESNPNEQARRLKDADAVR